jgi:hypothetical protein
MRDILEIILTMSKIVIGQKFQTKQISDLVLTESETFIVKIYKCGQC